MRIKNIIAITNLAACLAFVSTVQANGLSGCADFLSSSKPRLYVDFGLGYAFDSYFTSSTNIQTLAVGGANIIIDSTLSPESRPLTNNLTLGGGFLWEHPYQANSFCFPFISLGLNYQYNNFDQKKTLMKSTFIFQIADQSMVLDGQTHYTFLQNNLLVNLKMDLYQWDHIMPYVNLGLGTSWNQSKQQSSFIVETDNSEITKFSTYKARNNSFSYQMGIGLDYLVNESFWLSLGYNYNNFGRIEVSKLLVSSNYQDDNRLFNSSSQPFNFRNLTNHTIQLTGRYVFG